MLHSLKQCSQDELQSLNNQRYHADDQLLKLNERKIAVKLPGGLVVKYDINYNNLLSLRMSYYLQLRTTTTPLQIWLGWLAVL